MGIFFSVFFLEPTHVLSQCPSTTGPITIIGTRIPYQAYLYCGTITSVVIPSIVTFIGDRAFHRCSSLSEIQLINGLTIIGIDMFKMYPDPTPLSNIVIPSTITSIGWVAFGGCSSLSKVTFTNGLTVIGTSMFFMYGGGASTSLASITIPSSITSIGSQAFAYLTALECVSWVGPIITSPTNIFLETPSSTQECTFSPSAIPTRPSLSPTVIPSFTPSLPPSVTPTDTPIAPSVKSSLLPSKEPSYYPSMTPSNVVIPLINPITVPSQVISLESINPTVTTNVKKPHTGKHPNNNNKKGKRKRQSQKQMKEVDFNAHIKLKTINY